MLSILAKIIKNPHVMTSSFTSAIFDSGAVAGQCFKTLICLFVTMLNSLSVRAPKNKHDSMQKNVLEKKVQLYKKKLSESTYSHVHNS